MRILYLTNGFPYPLTSGYLRHYFLIRELARNHRVTLLSLVNPTYRDIHAAALEPFTERIFTFALNAKPEQWSRKALRRLQMITASLPPLRQMCQKVTQLMLQESFDLVVLSGKETLPALAALNETPVVVDICDAASVRTRGRMRYVNPARAAWLLLEYGRLRRVERALIDRASHLIFASSRDRDSLMGPFDSRATIVPNGVDTDYWRRSLPQPDSQTMVFTGAMSYPPNLDAALQLIEQVLPQVRQSLPQARLSIVGRDPPPELQRAGQRPGVLVTGYVDDVRPYLEEAAVFAAPLRFGAGIQNKLLEALAMQVPVIASPLAADGLRTDAGLMPPIKTAGSPGEFAQLIVQSMKLRPSDSTHEPGRPFVERHFSWRRSGEKLEEVIRTVARIRCSEEVTV